ncbi:hypothetical protein AVEN_40868-1 [Araneus ventricosus]|uniref:Uncharacterized protein n=1 Tax=Araneus ventricosus TaxID=182803 RepID=A0A4Y2V0J2_ARAVE|nr:hypothetical protein AVEN_40868-1 [Araneus ventricosus]
MGSIEKRSSSNGSQGCGGAIYICGKESETKQEETGAGILQTPTNRNGTKVCPTGGHDLLYEEMSVMKLVSNFRQIIIYELQLNTQYKNFSRWDTTFSPAGGTASPMGALSPSSATSAHKQGVT